MTISHKILTFILYSQYENSQPNNIGKLPTPRLERLTIRLLDRLLVT